MPGLRGRLTELRERVVGLLLGEPHAPRELRLPDMTGRIELSVGRADDSDLLIDEATVSRHHAVLQRIPEGWLVHDVGSTNGTRVNGWRVDEAAVQPGDVLVLGVEEFVLSYE